MPPIVRKRGRPKRHEVTVIGLPAKKHNKGGGDGNSAASKESWCHSSKCTLLQKKKVCLESLFLLSLTLSQ